MSDPSFTRSVRWLVWISAFVCACGRVAFDPLDDASNADGITIDATVVPASPCPVDTTTLFCDDFERADFSRWANASNVSRVASPVRTGTGALKASIPINTEEAWVLAVPTGLSSLPSFSLRFWVYVQADASLVQANFLTFANGTNAQELTVLAFSEELRVWRDTSTAAGYPSGALQRERWTCVELDVNVDDANGSFQVRVDGVPVITDPSTDTRIDGDYTELALGLPFSDFPNQGAITVYYDDVHLGPQPVGCN